MRLFKKQIKPCIVELFAGYLKRYIPMDEKWYEEEEKSKLIEKYKAKGVEIEFKERLVELPDRVSIPVEEYLEWKRYKQQIYEDLHG